MEINFVVSHMTELSLTNVFVVFTGIMGSHIFFGYGKLVDNFNHESDVTSLQDPFTSRPYKTLYYCVPRKIRRDILFQLHVECSPSSRLLVSALCSLRHRVEDYVFLVLSPCSTAVFALDCFSHRTTTSAVRLFYRTGWCVRCLLITESPRTPSHYRYQI